MKPNELSYIILAGGKSRRMGVNKADLDFYGRTFLETQITKARAMGFTDIIVSGYPFEILSITPVMDEFKERGPLGGLYSSFIAAKNKFCFVICVDVPQIVESTVLSLIDFHEKEGKEITLLSQNGKIEPLIGVYPASSYKKIYPIIKNGTAAVFRLIDEYDYTIFRVENDKSVMANINTPEDYQNIFEKSKK
ncbi:molybdenum cofactor guanylyltransferase [Acetobacterium sp.]|uniref:molybdenum cofactor guanylyltransferase n=1 Tax=Acetobacterium sp. TaxID=1872094 RepID=UPI002F40543C